MDDDLRTGRIHGKFHEKAYMIKDNQKHLNRLHVLLDALIIIAAYSLAYFIIASRKDAIALPARFYFTVLIIIVPVAIILNAINGMYAPKRVLSKRREIAAIFASNTILLLLGTLVLFLGSKNPYIYNFSRSLVIYFYAFTIIFELIERAIIRLVLRDIRAKGYNSKELLLVGYSRAAEGFIDRCRMNPEWGYNLRGILDNKHEIGYMYKNVPVIGKISDLANQLEENKIENSLDEIAITLSLEDYDYLEEIVNECERSGVHTKFIPDYNNIIPTIPQIEDVEGLPVINIRKIPLSELQNRFIKRSVDIFGSLFGLILFSPIMLITIIAIKLSSPGPIFFSQERIGRHGKSFWMYKFRSMVVQEDDDEKKEWTTKNDPRVTKVGKIIRSTSIDEMPQFWNILKGDMSLVGPRPERPQFVEKFKDEIPHYMIKHQVRPGLTGWAQVNGYRGDTSIEKRIEHDLYYIENWTVGFDFKIMFLTIFKGFINKNAY